MRTRAASHAAGLIVALAGSALPAAAIARQQGAPAAPAAPPPTVPPVPTAPAAPAGAPAPGAQPPPPPAAAVESVDEQLESLENHPIRSVTLQGILAEDEPLARNQIRVTPGAPLSAEAVRDDVHRLARLGRFERIEARVQPFSDGSVEVIYAFTPAPIIRDVVAVGNHEVSDADLAQAVGLLANTPANPFVLDQAKRRIRDLYQKKGYYQADVQIDEKELRDSGIVALRIREGDRLRVTSIRFAGNGSIPSKELQAKIGTKVWGVFNAGTLDDAQTQRDVASVERFYKDQGYLRAQVDRQVQPSPDGKEAVLTFVVSEGPRFTLRSVQVLLSEGANISDKPPTVLSPDQIAGLIPIKAGDVYSQEKIQKSLDAIHDAYGQMGYVEAGVRSLDRQSVDKPEVDLVLVVNEGRRYMTGVVTVKGNQFTQSRVIRRQVRVLPDRPLDTTSLKESEARLESLRIFKPGSIHITPQAEDPQNPGFRDVLVEMDEAGTGSVGFGVSASSDGGLVGSISLTQKNFDLYDVPDSIGEFLSGRAFRGAGQTFNITAAPGTDVSTYSMSISDPYLFETDYAGSGSFGYRQRDYDQYDEQRVGVYGSIGHRMGERWYATLTFRAERVELFNIDPAAAQAVWDSAGPSDITSLGVKLHRSALDKVVRPTRGAVIDLSVEQVGAMGGSYNFTKLGAEGSLYVPVDEDALGLRTVLLLRSFAYYIPQDETGVPVYERFYQGGRGFRGFDFRGIGPRGFAHNTLPPNPGPPALAPDTVGGTWSFFAGAQLEKPLMDQYVSGVVFLDSGTLTYDPGFSDYRASVGFGIRIYIPMLGPVPLAFDYGYAFLKQPGDRTQGFSFALDVPLQ